ncbi:ABC transporter permease [Mycobacterium paraterrae]|uniref:FtsX-like permease family protein n=1 Tax=Mycobacterium paraterrae TaxID=577492 RepID=A0ABY3VJ76_9MYCO|nr:FtsX-like permease family protein [Mycobacterium paraterrae]UMB69464.1 FtsX-like permease family protein [Mycobacterium paraterrae]
MARPALAAAASVLRLINLRAIRRHTLRALLAALSLGGGVAIVVAVMIETNSVRTAIDDVGYRIAGPAPLRIVGSATQGGIGPAVLGAAGKVPGVAVLAPVVRAATQVRDGDRDTVVLALGIDCAARWIIDPKVCGSNQKEPQVMATSTVFGHSLGKSPALATDVGQLSIAGLAQIPQLDDVNNGRVVVLPLSAAKSQFARGDRVDTVYLTLAEHADATAVQAAVAKAVDALGPGYRVLTCNDPAAGFNVNVILFPLLAIFALIAIGVGVILIAQLTRLSIQERRREVAIAAALGATPLMTFGGFLAEAALLGASGSVIGILLGIVIAHPVVASASELTQQFVGVNVPVVVGGGVVVAALGIGVLLAVLAALLPSRAASKTPIATELSGRAAVEDNQSTGAWRKVVALLAIGVTGVIAVWWATWSGGLAPWQASVANVSVVVAIVGLLLAAAYVGPEVLDLIRLRPERVRSAAVAIAFTGLRADQSRMVAIAGAVAVPVAVATLLSGFLIAINDGVDTVAKRQASDRLVLTTTRFTDWGSTDAKFSPDTMSKLNALPGVAGVERMAEVEITLANGELAYVRAEDRPTFSYHALAGPSPRRSIEANQLVIGGILARETGVRVGDTMLLGSGPKARRIVVGTIVATPEVGGRRIQMSYPLAEQIFGPQPAGLVFIKPAAGADLRRIDDEIRASRFDQPLTVVDADGYRSSVVAGESRFLAPLNTLKYGLLAIAFISVSSTLLLLGIRRRREVALIQALGATPATVFAVTTIEAVIASATGAILGAMVSIAIIGVVARAAIVDVGAVVPLIFPASEALGYAILAVLSAVLAAVGPAWQTTQAGLASQLRDD